MGAFLTEDGILIGVVVIVRLACLGSTLITGVLPAAGGQAKRKR